MKPAPASRRPRRFAWAVLTALAGLLLVLGVERGEYLGVLRWAQTLCTACIGLGR